ncbi:MAG TPA: hypothetical protein VGS19_38680 [Streptosporangiaceae bacterium]|nr:hypothetical protein [Streptosporangiaceae bacterium]
MITATNLPNPAAVPSRSPGTLLVAAVDVEWSKNYRVRGANVPFCYSLVWLALSPAGAGTGLGTGPYWYTSAYVHDTAETQELTTAAGHALDRALCHADLVTGHQLSSDLAVLAAASGRPLPGVAAARTAWHQRRQVGPAARPRIVDTRYDAGHILACPSRRLVDVCAGLGLDVSQPELRGTSMTALHRRWLETTDTTAREKVSVLNLRHSLSTALVAARAAGLGCWQDGLNVNRLLAGGLDGVFGWVSSPVFTALLGDSGAA